MSAQLTRNEQVKRKREQILRLAKRYGVTDIRVSVRQRGERIQQKVTLIF